MYNTCIIYACTYRQNGTLHGPKPFTSIISSRVLQWLKGWKASGFPRENSGRTWQWMYIRVYITIYIYKHTCCWLEVCVFPDGFWPPAGFPTIKEDFRRRRRHAALYARTTRYTYIHLFELPYRRLANTPSHTSRLLVVVSSASPDITPPRVKPIRKSLSARTLRGYWLSNG